MLHPFDTPKNVTREQWRARARAIQSDLEGLTIEELMRGGGRASAPPPAAHGQRRGGYDPNQPRVPAGQSDGGQWTDDDHWADHPLARARFAAARELPPIGPLGGRIFLVLRRALKIIEALRSENILYNLFGEPTGSISTLEINGERFFGSNSRLPLYTSRDAAEADALRAVMLRKYPELGSSSNVGEKPMDALYHSETNVLLRAARRLGGTLGGRTLEVVTDRHMCPTCEIMLPKVGLELGNPTVTFIGPRGEARTMRDGKWDDLRGYE